MLYRLNDSSTQMTVYTELSDVICNEVNTHKNLGASSMHLAPKPRVTGEGKRSMLVCQVVCCHTGHSCDSVFVNLCLPSLKKPACLVYVLETLVGYASLAPLRSMILSSSARSSLLKAEKLRDCFGVVCT